MRFPVTQKMLMEWGGARVFHDAKLLLDEGRVLHATYEPPVVRGELLWNNRPFSTAFSILADGSVESRCPCRFNREQGIVCPHVVALGLLLLKRATDPAREATYQEERRRAERMAAIDESAYLRRVKPETPGAVPARLRITLEPDWMDAVRRGRVPVRCEAEYDGARRALHDVSPDLPLCWDKQDETLLFVLEEIAEGPPGGRMELHAGDFVNLIRLRAGRQLDRAGAAPITVNETRLPTHLRMDLDRENGELILIAHTEIPFLKPGEFPFYVLAGRHGWAYGADNLWPLENVLPTPYHGIYAAPVCVGRASVLRFLRQELPLLSRHARVATDISPDLFTVEPGEARFRLHVRGSPASLAGTLFARYADTELVAAKSGAEDELAIPDPDDLMRYTVRNPEQEREAVRVLNAAGLKGDAGDALEPLIGCREVLNFLGGVLPALRRRGWQVEVEGRVAPFLDELDFAVPVVHIDEPPDGGWFDVGFDFEDRSGASISPGDVQLALRKGDAFIEKNGRTVLIDADSVNNMTDIFSDCASRESPAPGRFRMAGIYAAFVKSSLDSLDGVDVEAGPRWQSRAARNNRALRIERVPLGAELDPILRDYQKEGVDWLRFLEQNGFGGILADEMGLGKTVQTLAWLQLARHRKSARSLPALVVCPTSLVENWAEEAARFVPALRVLALTGPDRERKWADVSAADLAITSYALLRRDVELCVQQEFSAVVLDEAQHIKNRATQNAAAAKRIRAEHRLVLTGTPMENSVADLWSIMDFLMPGYLGGHELFRQHYELPVAHGGPDGEIAQIKLKRKLHPFLLRRLKRHVAKDLPPKIERIASCGLSADQQVVYTEVLQSSQRRISDMVSQHGYSRCRMEILTVLMRLRQICCHLGLLRLPDLKSEQPSAKLDLFFELLDEALDGGHRLLVFSQFVSMLQILRRELEGRSVTCCYLDGSTKDRMEVVRRFNTQRQIPAFLISLKAGGTGLNLTGADMVIHFDPWWNPAVENQATDRAYRIGQKRTVYSVKLITKGTVEEKVLALQKRKKALIDATIESDEQAMQAISWEDIQELLEL
ncbi:MAG: DEAD/DEAH box helicase [Kiritimatiellae bacterium]|nr:DEAD/DEAH box helicase [Kiritimatiellia bacterium]